MTQTMESLEQGLEALALDLDGRLVRPTDTDWDQARAAWNLTVDQAPTAVALPESVRDIQTIVRAAGRLGLRVAPQATGHNAMPLGPLARTILLSLARMRGVTIDAEHGRARVEAGAQWGDVTPRAAAHGWTALAGSSHDVGVAGYTLGGGISWLARSHGLAANSVLSLKVVTADGEHRLIDADHDPELFWALRGGGGSFAVVTAIELELYPISTVYAGVLFFPIERAGTVLHTWAQVSRDLPDEVMCVGRLLRFPPLPDLPEVIRGRSFAVVEAVSTLSEVRAGSSSRWRRGPRIASTSTSPSTRAAARSSSEPRPVLTGPTSGALWRRVRPHRGLDRTELAGIGIELQAV